MSAPPPPPPTSTAPTFDVHLLFGPMLIGVFFNMVLFGVLIAQQLTYYKTSGKDPLYMKIFVWVIFFLEVANAAFDISYMYEPLILHYGAFPDNLPTVFMTQPLCIILVGLPIQMFFIWRVRTLTGSNILPAVIFLFALTAAGGGLATSVRVPAAKHFSNIPHLFRSAEIWLIAESITDLMIAASLSIALNRSKTGFPLTDTVVDKIIRMTVQTGMITALFSILDMVSFLTVTNATLNFMWNIPISKLYSNALLSTLNARTELNRSMNGPRSGSWAVNGSGPSGTYVTDGSASKGTDSLGAMAFAGGIETLPGDEKDGIRMSHTVSQV
ncbi:hypothetical protein C8R43DRAFT_1050199 [Mycena crocata]|nr:hypothetical protein C8R43DRAFT_1050199 [Mycena crocata]